jgi:hypothetical protein
LNAIEPEVALDNTHGRPDSKPEALGYGGRMRTVTFFCCLGALLLSSFADAKLASIPIDELIARSDAIVIARVSQITSAKVPAHPSRSGNVVYADAIAQRALKGSVSGNFRFLAQVDFICEVTGAVKDEDALFFLYRDSEGSLNIMAFGHGRMPLRTVNGKQYVTPTSYIILPKDVPTIPALDPSSRVSVELGSIEKLMTAGRGTRVVF